VIFILSGTRKQALEFAKEQGWKEQEWKSVNRNQDMYGRIDYHSHLLKIGTWYELPNCNELEAYFKKSKERYQ